MQRPERKRDESEPTRETGLKRGNFSVLRNTKYVAEGFFTLSNYNQ